MGSTVLLPVTNYAPWARIVAEVLATVEDEATEVVVLHVFAEGEVDSTRSNLNSKAFSMDDLASRKAAVGAAADVLADEGFGVRSRGVRENGRMADDILSVADGEHVDRIYLYGRKRSPAGKAAFGSTLQRVLLNSSVPVVVVPSTAN